MRLFTCLTILICCIESAMSQQQPSPQHSVARRWNEVLLEAIRHDYARPTVHARNLFHTSIALYDCWAVFDPVAEPYMLGRTVHGFDCPFNGITTPQDIQAAQEKAMSYAAYRLLNHRFANSPGALQSLMRFDTLMANLGFETNFTSTDYSDGNPAALGNHLAANIISYGLHDGSNEANGYANQYYQPVNPSLIPILPGNPDIVDPNRWQPLTLQVFIDQSGNVYPITTPPFLSPEWGNVAPFSMTENDLTVYQRDGFDYWVYHDPGMPPQMDTALVDDESEQYKWTFELVSVWSSHLTSADTTVWDISPASIGNIQSYPTDFSEHVHFYDLINGGDAGQGHAVNPYTGLPYEPQIVKRGDYARVLAEFWADGPQSETPPGHWFTILNYVSDHAALEKRFMGQGEVLPDLEWDVKSYFALGGAMHDAAVTAWGIKGWYDYIRPISAIRFMADLGQSTDSEEPHFHHAGLPLIEGKVELVKESDPLAGVNGENVGKIKLYAWKGHQYISDPEVDQAGVDWILAEEWWSYQRPSFVTPPFAGYISGHSTFSRTAAEVLTEFTGDPFFPGGMCEFHAPMNEFLVFEEGPSEDVVLQWATYRDASDQCSLSRIWGGIHPPADDIPGRHIGMELGPEAFQFAKTYFDGSSIITSVEETGSDVLIYPNPLINETALMKLDRSVESMNVNVFDPSGRTVRNFNFRNRPNSEVVSLDLSGLSNGIYIIRATMDGSSTSQPLSILR